MARDRKARNPVESLQVERGLPLHSAESVESLIEPLRQGLQQPGMARIAIQGSSDCMAEPNLTAGVTEVPLTGQVGSELKSPSWCASRNCGCTR
ncbi:hypothetical protein Taro_026739 [Colocasia esculenta]|uniref:Uncharacterized protein n=1 Tax=Colocasia esculenta TaxID=4460 RepID=A0A843VS75_COLES|nr:hypothetical protein [Colocasia esculenta]